MFSFEIPIKIEIDYFSERIIYHGTADHCKTLMAALIGKADVALNLPTIRHAASYDDHAAGIVAALSDNQKPVARAFLTALLAELGDA